MNLNSGLLVAQKILMYNKLATLVGEHKNFLRLNKVVDKGNYSETLLTRNYIITNSLNLSVDDKYFNGSTINSNIHSNSM